MIIISERNWWRQYLHVYVNIFSNWELKPDPGIVSTLIFVLETYFFYEIKMIKDKVFQLTSSHIWSI